MVPKKTRGGMVNAQMALHFGSEASLSGKSTVGNLAAGMLMRGTAKHNRKEISDAFDKLKAQVNIFGDGETATVMIETVRENLPAVMKLVTEVLREANFPENEFEMLKQESLAGIEYQLKEPTAVASKAFTRHLSPYPKGHPRFVATAEEDMAELKAAKLEDAKAFYKTFYGAGAGELTLVGDFDPKEMEKLVKEELGSWKSKTAYARIPHLYKDSPAINLSLETPDKQNAFFLAGMSLAVRDTDPDYPALVIGNFMMGGGFLNSRLATRIRQKEGISYGVGSQLQVEAKDTVGSWVTYAIYAPQNADKLEAAFREELEKVVKDGFTAEEIAAAKSGWLQNQQVSRAQDRELAMRLARHLENGRTLAFNADLEKKIAALTGDQILAALRKHLFPAKISIVKAGDFAKAKKEAEKK
jgi:zinc protease